MITYGYQVAFTRSPGDRVIYEGTGFPSREAMREERTALLREICWKPPKWWQWWRWGDTRVIAGYANSAEPPHS